MLHPQALQEIMQEAVLSAWHCPITGQHPPPPDLNATINFLKFVLKEVDDSKWSLFRTQRLFTACGPWGIKGAGGEVCIAGSTLISGGVMAHVERRTT